MQAVDNVNSVLYLYQPRCKQWSCPECARDNKLFWQARIGYGYDIYINQGVQGWNMLTITSSPKLTNTAQCLYVWPSQWAKLSARIRRRYKNVKYVLMPEQHQDGRVHWHMIASNNISTRWLKDNAPYCGLGFEQHAKRISNSSKAIYYVSKYLGKSILIAKWPKYLRRIATSQKWPILPPESDFTQLELDWVYLTTYPSEGLWYLAEGLAEKTGLQVKILGS